MGSWVYRLQMRDLPKGSNTNTLMQQELEKLGNEKCRESEEKKIFFPVILQILKQLRHPTNERNTK